MRAATHPHGMEKVAMIMIPQIHEIQVQNYKSIGQAIVELEPFTVFVGPNGSGKSNLVDVLAFVQECLSESIELAFRNRGGVSAVRRRSGGHPYNIGISLSMDLAGGTAARYAFVLAAKPKERFRVARELCWVDQVMGQRHVFEVQDGRFKTEIPGIRPKVSPDRLMLYAASATDEFRPVYDFLTSMRTYSIVPDRLRELQEPDSGEYLNRDGSNAAAVLKRLQDGNDRADDYGRLCRLLSNVVEGLEKVEYRQVAQKETLQFRQDVGLKDTWTFDSLNMSDGTLRVLGLLLAAYQVVPPSVIAIEEPESTVHPACAELVIEVLMSAANDQQVLITSHSPDILDYKYLTDKHIRVVDMDHGSTLIAPVSPATRESLLEKLFTPGELLRVDELTLDKSAARLKPEQMDLFTMHPSRNSESTA